MCVFTCYVHLKFVWNRISKAHGFFNFSNLLLLFAFLIVRSSNRHKPKLVAKLIWHSCECSCLFFSKKVPTNRIEYEYEHRFCFSSHIQSPRWHLLMSWRCGNSEMIIKIASDESEYCCFSCVLMLSTRPSARKFWYTPECSRKKIINIWRTRAHRKVCPNRQEKNCISKSLCKLYIQMCSTRVGRLPSSISVSVAPLFLSCSRLIE